MDKPDGVFSLIQQLHIQHDIDIWNICQGLLNKIYLPYFQNSGMGMI